MTEFSLSMRRERILVRRLSRRCSTIRSSARRFTYSVRWRWSPSSSASSLVVPTAYWVRLRMPRLRPVVEFITLLPLVIPAIVIVFGYIRLYNTSSISAADGLDRRAPTCC